MPPKTEPKDVKDTAKEPTKAGLVKDKNLQAAIAIIQKQYGEGSIMRMGAAMSHVDISVIPTGALSLDLALGVGGLPRGRVVELYGPESGGKTTLSLSVIASAQKAGGLAAMIDVEHALDPSYARRIGVNLDDLLVSQPDSGEEALTVAETLIRSNAVDVLVIDSVAALVPRQELEGQMGDATVGAQARLMSQALRHVRAKVVKNKVAPPFTEAEFDIMYDCGISREGSVIDVATELGVLEKRGSWLAFEGQQLGQGREATKEALRTTPAVLEKIITIVKQKVSEGAAVGKGFGVAAS